MKVCPLTRLRLHRQGAPVSHRNASCNGQPETSAAWATSPLSKTIKYVWQQFRRNARSLVGYRDNNRFCGFGDPHRDRPFFAVAHGIFDQISERLHEPVRVD